MKGIRIVGGAAFWEEANLIFAREGVYVKEILCSFIQNTTEQFTQTTAGTDDFNQHVLFMWGNHRRMNVPKPQNYPLVQKLLHTSFCYVKMVGVT